MPDDRTTLDASLDQVWREIQDAYREKNRIDEVISVAKWDGDHHGLSFALERKAGNDKVILHLERRKQELERQLRVTGPDAVPATDRRAPEPEPLRVKPFKRNLADDFEP